MNACNMKISVPTQKYDVKPHAKQIVIKSPMDNEGKKHKNKNREMCACVQVSRR